MSDYIVTARKWRPMRFDDVIGQSHVTTTLRNAIASDRIAHAYLFSGPRGVGKTTTARLLAKAINCFSPVQHNPDNVCESCVEITEGKSFDVIEIDGASNRGVDEIRNLRESVRYAATRGKYKVYIIDEVHMLTKEAFNALLKTLEEPPRNVLFIFATTEVHKVPATILSRCQRFDFRRIAISEIMANLKAIAASENLEIEEDALLLIAKKGDGSLRDAQSIFDQVVALCGRTITSQQILQALHLVDQELYFRTTDLVRARDSKEVLALVDHIMTRGYDIREFLGGLIEHLRNLLIAATTGSTALIEASDALRKRYEEEAAHFSVPTLLRLIRYVGTTESSIRWSTQPRFKLEADMVQLVTLPDAHEIGALVARLDELKKKLDAGLSASVIPARSTTPPPAPSPARLRPTIAPAASTPLTVGEPSPAVLRTATSPATELELRSRWRELVDEVRRQRISLGSVMEAADLLGARDGVVRIGCANDFQASSIKRNRELLSEILQRTFHIRARVEVEITEHTPSPATEGGVPGPVPDEHPVVKAIMRELGAEPLQ